MEGHTTDIAERGGEGRGRESHNAIPPLLPPPTLLATSSFSGFDAKWRKRKRGGDTA